MPIKINGRLMCEYCFAPLRRHETCTCGTTVENEARHPSVLPLGAELDRRYIVGHVLGKGGFGVTYLCYDSLLNNRVAIKEYMPKGIAYRDSSGPRISVFNDDQIETFKRGAVRVIEEAETIRLFNGNPNIISVNGYFNENNTVYYVMEYLEGCDVRAYMKEHGVLSEAETAYVAEQMLRALTIVHSRHILHRDISPDNIFICTDKNLKLIDFGAAKELVGSESQMLSMVLKQGFAPVEQYQTSGKQQGPWTDIYALGATMYYCVTGRLPPDSMSRVSGDDLDMSEFSPAMGHIIEKAMALHAADRYQSAYDMMEDIERLPLSELEGELPADAAERPSAAHEHHFNAIMTPPSCTGKGFTTHLCRCGISFTDNYIPPLGHLWSEWHSTDGRNERICRRCGETESLAETDRRSDADYEDFT